MVKLTSNKVSKMATWGGGIFNHTIILNNKENTRKLEL